MREWTLINDVDHLGKRNGVYEKWWFCRRRSNVATEKIQMVDIDNAEKALKKFVMEFEKLYGKDMMTFNVHLMTHISASLRNWGPLWASSTFSFESFNCTLLRFFHGTTHVQQQIVKRFLKWRDITNKADKYMNNAKDSVKKLFYALQNSKQETAKSAHLSENVRVFGNPHPVKIPVRHMLAIEDLFGVRV
ncbi:Retrovirus-related Pol poly from transposon TNT 1 [Labeo rohita]|uniref:Retrovirus-related Pol poly from transposon TNT 1 n=1 Tax=Labeo rohita TaxID=84645 RepID=A0A498NWF0_LABRO|nr:Retrovirus-related Pol poly from transposon TNT 1 [Labeo rohita]